MAQNGSRIEKVVVFGLDDQRRPRAGIFSGDGLQAVVDRASDLELCKNLVEGALTELEAELKPGKMEAAGYAFIPPITRTLYEKLLVATNIAGPSAPTEANKSKGKPHTASEQLATHLPKSVEEFAVGSLVLAEDHEPGNGWYEAIIVEVVGADQFRLRFRDYADEPDVVRRGAQLALFVSGM
jgi:hypothetical protein